MEPVHDAYEGSQANGSSWVMPHREEALPVLKEGPHLPVFNTGLR